MAQSATIYKAQINVADMSRNVYLDNSVTLAQHPSEKLDRMMLRLVAWSLYADERLQFTKGLCEDSEPELWIKNYNDDIELWIELGLPDEKRLKKACNRAQKVVLFTYNDKAAAVWKKNMLNKLHPLHNLTVVNIFDEVLETAANAASRTMQIQATIEDDHMWFSVGETTIAVDPQAWKIDGL